MPTKAANCARSTAFEKTNPLRVPANGVAARRSLAEAHAVRAAAIRRIAINVVLVPVVVVRASETKAVVKDKVKGRTEIKAHRAERVSHAVNPVNPPATSHGRINRNRRGWATKAATTPVVVRHPSGVARIRTPDGVRPLPADTSRADQPVRGSSNVVAPTNNFRATISAIARNRRRKMDVRSAWPRQTAPSTRALISEIEKRKPGVRFRSRVFLLREEFEN
jgi:hypothetical protein